MLDVRGLEVTAASEAAVRNFDATLAQYLRFGLDTGDCLKRTLAEDPEMALAHCVKGYFFMLFCVPALTVKARASLEAGRRSAAERGATERERRHLDALDAWTRGEFEEAVSHLEVILAAHPRDILALKLAHYLHTSISATTPTTETRSGGCCTPGTTPSTVTATCSACTRSRWRSRAPTQRRSRRAGPRWSAIRPTCGRCTRSRTSWRCRTGAAKASPGIRESEPQLGDCNNFGYHVWWHLALFHLELEEVEPVLRLYDERMRADLSDEYLDICNATSMLWRLEERGVDVGDRWNELAERCEARTSDHQMVFPDVHYMFALAAGGRDAAVERMLDSMRTFAEGGATEQRVMREAGVPIGRAIAHWYRGEYAEVVDVLAPVRYRLPLIGGSHAQRDLFHQVLIAAALASGRHETARALLSERTARKPRQPVDVEALRAGAGRARRRRGRRPGARYGGSPPCRVACALPRTPRTATVATTEQGSCGFPGAGHPSWERGICLPRASCPQRAEGPRLFKRAGCPRSRERHRMPRWFEARARRFVLSAAGRSGAAQEPRSWADHASQARRTSSITIARPRSIRRQSSA